MATRVQAGHFSSSRLSPGALQIARDCAANVAVTGVRGGEGRGEERLYALAGDHVAGRELQSSKR